MKVSIEKTRNKADWNALAQAELQKIIRKCQRLPALRKKGPLHAPWTIELRLIGSQGMQTLNERYRGKAYTTDVLSFPAPEVFCHAGILGELVICLPVMKKQARELKHAPEEELRVLLAHGVLHLLGYDHELGPRQAATMKKWENQLLGNRSAKLGLIQRSR